MHTETQPGIEKVEHQLDAGDLVALTTTLTTLSTEHIIDILERLGMTQRAVVYRLLAKDTALAVFEGLDATLQRDLVSGLKDEEVAAIFAEMDPDDRVVLLDELPATVAQRLLQGLPPGERELTAGSPGIPAGVDRATDEPGVRHHPDRSDRGPGPRPRAREAS